MTYPQTPEHFIEFNYESVNSALYTAHPNLSGYWTDLSWDDKFAYVTYFLELFDGKKATVLVDHWGNVTMSDEVKQEMDDIG